jgi:hypothetical protein
LIFDECPYKIYSAKVTGTATLKYIPFAEGATNRLYKGEGSIQFTCYSPFARCVFSNKDINDNIKTYSNIDKWKKVLKNSYSNLNEWWGASNISPNKNFGQQPVPFTKTIIGPEKDKSGKVDFGAGRKVSWKFPDSFDTNITVVLDTKTGIAKGSDKKIYNKYISGDSTLKIPVGFNCANQDLEFTCLYF